MQTSGHHLFRFLILAYDFDFVPLLYQSAQSHTGHVLNMWWHLCIVSPSMSPSPLCHWWHWAACSPLSALWTAPISPSSAEAPESTVACNHWRWGRCSRGSECPFQHHPEEFQTRSDGGPKNVACRFFAAGNCHPKGRGVNIYIYIYLSYIYIYIAVEDRRNA